MLEVKIAIFHSQTTKNRVSKGKLRWGKKKTTLTGWEVNVFTTGAQ